MANEYEKGVWFVASEILSDMSLAYNVYAVWNPELCIPAVDLEAAVKIVDCLTENAVG